MVNLIVAIEFDAEFGCHSNIKLERIRCRLFQILGLLTFVLQRFAKHLNFVVLHIFINLLTNELVNGIHLGRCTILLFNQSHRNHAWTETRIISLLTEVFQRFLNILLIIGLFYGEGQQTIHLVCNFKWNIHLAVLFLYYVFVFANYGTQIYALSTNIPNNTT